MGARAAIAAVLSTRLDAEVGVPAPPVAGGVAAAAPAAAVAPPDGVDGARGDDAVDAADDELPATFGDAAAEVAAAVAVVVAVAVAVACACCFFAASAASYSRRRTSTSSDATRALSGSIRSTV